MSGPESTSSSPDIPNEPAGRSSPKSTLARPGIESAEAADEFDQRGVSLRMEWYGPLPPPEALRAFGKIDPALPAKIMAMTEAEGNHRRAMDKRILDASIREAKSEQRIRNFGQWLALAIAMAILGAFVFAVAKGLEKAAIGMSVAMVAVVGLFITGQYRARRQGDRPKDRSDSAEQH